MRKLILLFVAIVCFGLTINAQVFTNEFMDFNNNLVPTSWTENSYSKPSRIQNGKMNAFPTDDRCDLFKVATMPTNIDSVVIEYDCNVAYSDWGLHNWFELTIPSNKIIGCTMGYGSNDTFGGRIYFNDGTNPVSNYNNFTYATGYGSYHIIIIITQSKINFKAINIANQIVAFDQSASTALNAPFKVSEITKISFTSYTTTDNANWTDNIRIKLLTNYSLSTNSQNLNVGRWVTIPINTTTLNSTDNVISYQFDYNYDQTKLEYNTAELTGTWAENGSLQVNTSSIGKLSIAWARQTPMTGIGTGAILKLQFKSIDAGVTTPTITNAMFNNDLIASITNGTITSTYKYGDIDANDFVRAYDAALAIQYSVGIDPIPSIDPLPWENWRIKVANVDGQGGVTASDASDILKFTVGLINKFAAGKKSINNADINIKIENGNLVFRSSGELFGLNVFVNENKNLLGIPQISNSNMLSATNISTSSYAIGLATSSAQKADEIFMKIPIIGSTNSKVTFDMIVNTENKSVTVDLSVTGVNEINEKSLSMFPNPVNNELTINNISKNAIISIYDLNGKLLINKTAKSTIEKIDVSSLANGVYSIKVNDNNTTKTSKLIKQ